jgi:hypothetical protein
LGWQGGEEWRRGLAMMDEKASRAGGWYLPLWFTLTVGLLSSAVVVLKQSKALSAIVI